MHILSNNFKITLHLRDKSLGLVIRVVGFFGFFSRLVVRRSLSDHSRHYFREAFQFELSLFNDQLLILVLNVTVSESFSLSLFDRRQPSRMNFFLLTMLINANDLHSWP